jgi:hypothetical protein
MTDDSDISISECHFQRCMKIAPTTQNRNLKTQVSSGRSTFLITLACSVYRLVSQNLERISNPRKAEIQEIDFSVDNSQIQK